MAEDSLFDPHKARRLSDATRLEKQLSKDALARLLGLKGTEDILDLGCGTGFYTDIVAAWTTGLIYAVELQPEMLEGYRERGVPQNVRLIQEDIRRLTFPDKSIDLAYSIAVYHETKGDLGLPTWLPAFRSPGRLVVIDWRSDPESWESGPPAHLRFDKSSVSRSLQNHFRDVRAENVGRFMFAVTATSVIVGPT
ncbi:MAG: class I SAM-dependent methyltransferase [Actinobacteria bacterium]|nr:class I SAM-dependent methyltransferase [Actinomycetota bacterium]